MGMVFQNCIWIHLREVEQRSNDTIRSYSRCYWIDFRIDSLLGLPGNPQHQFVDHHNVETAL